MILDNGSDCFKYFGYIRRLSDILHTPVSQSFFPQGYMFNGY